MIRRTIFLLFIILILLMGPSCKRVKGGTGDNGIKVLVKDGIRHVFNGSKPLKGTIQLELEKILTLDSLNNPKVPETFNQFAHDTDGNVYLVNTRTIRAHRFSRDGSHLASFLKRGEGPGEFPFQFGGFQVIGDRIWITHPRKIAWFDGQGTFIDEIKLKKPFTHMSIVSENRFIASFSQYDKEDQFQLKPINRICALMGHDQTVLTRLLEDDQAGFTQLRTGNRISRLYSSGFTRDILHGYNHKDKTISTFMTGSYIIHQKKLSGDTYMIIHRDHRNKMIDDAVKKEILDTFNFLGADRLQSLGDSLPPSLNAITRIEFLPNGYSAVHRLTGFQKDEIDIFDRNGRFIYTIEPSETLPDFIQLRFHQNRVAVIQNRQDRDVYESYRIKNLREIFGAG